MKKPVIVVTGSGGQLGKELQVAAKSHPQFAYHFLDRENMPVDDFEIIHSVFETLRPDYLINCAAYTAVDRAEAEKEMAFLINAEAVGFLAETCKEFGTKFIHISTDYVFDGTKHTPYQEDDIINPLGVYGASKQQGERLAMEKNPDALIIRTSWVYSSYGNNFVKTMIRLMKEKQSLKIVNDQIGSPTYAADLASAILSIITKMENAVIQHYSGIFHYSNEATISWYDFAIAIKAITGSRCEVHPIPTSEYPTPAKRPLHAVMDKTKFITTFQIPLKSWKNSLENCIALLLRQ